jgi:uncharacterized protein YjiS (DUF1127 family)
MTCSFEEHICENKSFERKGGDHDLGSLIVIERTTPAMIADNVIAGPFPLRRAAAIQPATPSLPRLWLRRLRERAEIRALLRQPDSVLADCGLTRAQARALADRPFWRA